VPLTLRAAEINPRLCRTSLAFSGSLIAWNAPASHNSGQSMNSPSPWQATSRAPGNACLSCLTASSQEHPDPKASRWKSTVCAEPASRRSSATLTAHPNSPATACKAWRSSCANPGITIMSAAMMLWRKHVECQALVRAGTEKSGGSCAISRSDRPGNAPGKHIQWRHNCACGCKELSGVINGASAICGSR
jgi:hypothetical protein